MAQGRGGLSSGDDREMFVWREGGTQEVSHITVLYKIWIFPLAFPLVDAQSPKSSVQPDGSVARDKLHNSSFMSNKTRRSSLWVFLGFKKHLCEVRRRCSIVPLAVCV